MITALVVRLVSLRPNLPPLQAVQLPNGEVGVILRSLCAFLNIDFFGQQKRIAHSQTLRGALTKATVATRGGPQEMVVLLAWAVPLWATGIQPNRLTAARHAAVLILQQEAVPALYRAFWHAAAPEAAPPPPPEIAPSDSLEGRVAVLEAALREETTQRTALARRLGNSERLLAAAIQRLFWLGDRPTEPPPPATQPPKRGPGRPRRRR